MKKIILLIFVVLMSFEIGACSKKEELKIFNWGAYLDDDSIDGVDLVTQFEKKYHCSIKYITFDSNESAIAKMKTESYDIVIPSDYAIEQLVQSEMLTEIDWDKIEGYSKSQITSSVQTMLNNLKNEEDGFDFLKYAVPYFSGSVGILFNPEKVSREELEEKQWNIFLDTKYKNRVAYYDSSQDGFMVPLKQLGYSMNTKNLEEINEAYDWLIQMKKTVNPAFKTDELISEMPSLKYDFAMMYSGDALYCIQLAEEAGNTLDFFVPSIGTNVWADGMVIPKSAKNTDLAYKFISFICDAKNAEANAEYIGYISTVQEAFDSLISEEGCYYDYKDYYKLTIHDKDEMYRYDKKTKVQINNKWLYVRMS